MKVTNISKAMQGVHAKSGRVFIRPGEAKDVEFTDHGFKQAKRLTGLLEFGKAEAKAEAPKHFDGPSKTAAEVLAMASDGSAFMAFKSAASKLLGGATPSKKDEIIAALEELATKPE